MEVSKENQVLGRLKRLINLLVPLPFAFTPPAELLKLVEPVVPDCSVVIAKRKFLADKNVSGRQFVSCHFAAGGPAGYSPHAPAKNTDALLASLIDLTLGHGRIGKKRTIDGPLSLPSHRW